MYVLLQAAACRRMVGDLKEAAEVYEHGMFYRACLRSVECSCSCVVIQADSANNDAKMALAEIYEILNEPRKALDLVMQGATSYFATQSRGLWDAIQSSTLVENPERSGTPPNRGSQARHRSS